MSTAVDQRVVEMRFDNKQFESGVSDTMSTLDKLKQKLNLSGASKGLDDINASAKNINLAGLGGAVEAVSAKFSALQVMGVTALANITNSAVNAGKRIVSALTIDPIKTGLSEYETQINAVQTILANTESKGTTLGQVNSALDELNKYADMTIYNFTEMTRNIGTFTAAGVDLKTSVNAIQGIANLAAVSGSNSQQASTAMYQLSQALASGTVKLMDWNSVVNAGMGGQVFQDALKETSRHMTENAKALKKMSKARREEYQKTHGYTDEQMKSMMAYNHNVDELIKKNGSFRESLQAGWINSDVLTETLSHFTMAAEEGSVAWDKYRQSLIDDGYTEAQADAILKLSNTATDAATKVKTASQLWDTLKETAQSGWTQTWEIILGDFGEAKELFSGIYQTISPLIEAMSTARNELLAEGLSSGWKQLLGEGIADEEGYRDSIKAVAKDHGLAIDEMIKAEKELDTSLSDNDAFQKVLQKGLSDGTITSDMLTKSVTHLADKMRNMSDAERKAAGYTEEHVMQIEELEKGLADGSISMDEFVKKMSRPSGRQNLIQGLLNSFNALMSVVAPIKEAFSDIFPAATGEQVYQLTEKFKAFTENLKIGSETADKIKRVFKGVFSVLDIGKKVITSVVNAFLKLIGSDGVSSFADFLLNTAASLGDFFTSLNEGFDADGLAGMLTTVANGIGNFVGITTGKIESFGDVLSVVGEFVTKVASKIWGGTKIAFGWLAENFSASDIFAGLAGGGIFVAAKKFIGFLKDVKEGIDGLFGKGEGGGGGLKEKFSELLDGVHESLASFSTGIKVSSFVAIAAAIAILASAFGKISELDAEDIAKSLTTMGIALGVMMKAINSMPTNTKFSSGFKKIFSSGFTDFSQSTSLIKSGIALIMLAKSIDILSDAMVKLADLSWDEIAKGLVGVGGGIVAVCGGLKLLDGTKVSLGTSIAMLALAEACKVLGDAMQKFVGFSWDEIGRGLAGMGGALVELVAALSIVSKVGGFGALLGSGGIWIAVQSLSDLAAALADFGTMQWDEIGRGLVGMGGAIGELAIVLGALSKISTVSVSGNIGAGIFGSLGKIGGSGGFAASISGLSHIFSAGAIWVVIQGLKDLADALTDFGSMSWGEIGAGLVAMGGALAEVGAVTGALGKLTGFSGIFGAAAIWVAVQGLQDLATAFQSFGSMSWGEIGKGLVAMGGALLEVGAISGGLGYLAGAAGILGGAAIWTAVQGLQDLATALQSFGSMSWEEIDRGIVAMGGALIEVGAISGGLGYISGLGSILGGAAIWTAVQGLGDLADALKKFGDMSWDEVGRGLTAMGAALGELALGSLANILSGFGAGAIAEMAAPLGVLADSVQRWKDVTVPEDLGKSLSTLASGIMAFTFGGMGAGALSEAAPGVGIMADSVSKWSKVTVPENLGGNLETLAAGVKAFTWGGLGAGALAEAAPAVGDMADAVAKWSNISVPESLGSGLESLGAGVKAFTFGGNGAGNLSEAVPGVRDMADAVAKWSGVTVPDSLGTNLSALATGVKAFTFGGSGADSLTTAAPGVGQLADSVMKWTGVTIPDGLVENLDTLADGVKKFTLGGSGADTIATCAAGLGTMADSVRKWTGLNIPENLGTNMSSLATAVKSFTWGGGAADTINVAAKGLGTMADSVAKWTGLSIPEGFGDILTKLSTAVTTIAGIGDVSTTATSLSALADSALKLGGIAYDTIATGLTNLSTSITTLSTASSSVAGLGSTIYNELIAPLKNTAVDVSSIGTNIVDSIIKGAKGRETSLNASVSSIISNAASASETATGSFKSAGETLGSKLKEGLDAKGKDATTAGKTLGDKAADGVEAKYESAKSAGKYVGDGIVAGLNAKYIDVYRAGYKLGEAANKGFRAAEQIQSPSKVMIRDGKFVGEGVVIGIKSMAKAVYNAGYAMGDSAIRGMSKTIANISDAVNYDIDVQPTIRPILDLSDVKSGARMMSSLLPATSSVDIMANAGAISSMMSHRGQNGSNDDVVSAINKLRRDIGNMPRESYNINGVTYDDGSNVATAVREIVRAARTERRV